MSYYVNNDSDRTSIYMGGDSIHLCKALKLYVYDSFNEDDGYTCIRMHIYLRVR